MGLIGRRLLLGTSQLKKMWVVLGEAQQRPLKYSRRDRHTQQMPVRVEALCAHKVPGQNKRVGKAHQARALASMEVPDARYDASLAVVGPRCQVAAHRLKGSFPEAVRQASLMRYAVPGLYTLDFYAFWRYPLPEADTMLMVLGRTRWTPSSRSCSLSRRA